MRSRRNAGNPLGNFFTFNKYKNRPLIFSSVFLILALITSLPIQNVEAKPLIPAGQTHLQDGSAPAFSLIPSSFPAAPRQYDPSDVLPTVSVTAGSVRMGEDFTLTATFRNAGTKTGYGPFIDIYVPHKGTDGIYPDEPNYDGISPQSGSTYSASYLSASLTAWTLDFGVSGCVTHPLAIDASGIFQQVCGGTPGDQLIVVQLPFGSFTPAQPTVDISIPMHLSSYADLGPSLNIRARGGFYLGETPLNDWCCTIPPDISILSDTGNPATWIRNTNVIPTLISLTKTNNEAEGETASGENFPHQFTITASIAPGQTVNNLRIVDVIPSNVAYNGGLTASPAFGIVHEPPIGLPSPAADLDFDSYNENELHITFPSVSGGSASITFDYFIPQYDAASNQVITANTGAPVNLPNSATAVGDWQPLDPRDQSAPPPTNNIAIGPITNSPTANSIAVQKGYSLSTDVGSVGPTPGDIVQYTINFQVSDYFAFQNLIIPSDTLSDGQHFFTDGTRYPTLQITENNIISGVIPFAGSNYSVTCHYSGGPGPECNSGSGPNDGTTSVFFDISQQLSDSGLNPQMWGGAVHGGVGATTGTITFYARILDMYTDTVSPGGSYSLLQRDSLTNTNPTMQGVLLDTSTCSGGVCTPFPGDPTMSNGSGASMNLGTTNLVKSIFAVNGVPCAVQPCSSVKVAHGDNVTFRLTYPLLLGDFASLTLTDYLPLPIFKADNPHAPDAETPPLWTKDTDGNATPAIGKWQRGSADSQFASQGIDPTTSVSSATAGNYVKFDFGSYEDPNNNPLTIDILFTVRLAPDPYADNLLFTNQGQQQDINTPGTPSQTLNITQLTLGEPVIVSSKSAVSTDHAGITPTPGIPLPIVFTNPGLPAFAPWSGDVINSDWLGTANAALQSAMIGVDGNDLVKFVLVMQNTGSSPNGAFDITVKDIIPAGYVKPLIGIENINLQVYRGDGTTLGYTNVGAGSLFEDGIRVNDPGVGSPEYGNGACQVHDDTSGRNVVIITYDLRVDSTIIPGQYLCNEGQLLGYSGNEGGPNYLPGPVSDSACTTIGSPVLEKTLVSTEIEDGTNSKSEAVIGEYIKYKLKITLPEGIIPDGRIIDTMAPGLAFVDVTSVTLSPHVSTSNVIGTGTAPTNVTIGTSGGGTGNQVTFDFGAITNNQTDNSTVETIEIEYRASVVNVSGNHRGIPLPNSAVLTWTALDENGNPSPKTDGPRSVSVDVIEPSLQVVKNANPTSADAFDTVTYTIDISHLGISDTDAYNLNLSDLIPVDTTYVAGSFKPTLTPGLAPTTYSDNAGLGPLSASWDVFPLGSSSQMEFQVTLNLSVYPDEPVTNQANIQWTSLPGDETTARSIHNPLAVERTGDATNPGGVANNYTTSSTAVVRVYLPASDKFIKSTSEPYTSFVNGLERVTIGEVVRFRLTVRLPEGTIAPMTVVEHIPTGMRFLDDGSAKLAFVSDGAGIASSTIVDALAFKTGPGADINLVTLDYVLQPADINGGPFTDGIEPTFQLGSLVNNDSDGNLEYAVIEFNALVDNVASNQGFNNSTGAIINTVLPNSYTVVIRGGTPFNSITVNTQVSEPVIRNANVTKAIVGAVPVDAGDLFTFRITVTNSANGDNASPAFNVNLTDAIDAIATVTGAVTISEPGGYGYTNTSAGQNINVMFNRLDAGATVTVDIPCQLIDTLQAGYLFTNTANITYTSLEGDHGTAGNPTGSSAPGNPGDDNGERTGSGGVNDYTAQAVYSNQLATPLVDKIAASPSTYTIGEYVDYTINVTLPEGVTRNLLVRDTLGVGLIYDSFSINSAAFGGTVPAPTLSTSGSGPTQINLTFGDTTTNADNNLSNNVFIVNIRARVANILTNIDGTVLHNTALLQYTNPITLATMTINDVIAPTDVTVTVREPLVTIAKTISTAASPADAGGVVTYQVVLSNTNANQRTAFDVYFTDTIPSELENLALVSITSTGAVPIPVPSTEITGLTQLRVPNTTDGTFDLPYNSAVTIRFTGTIKQSAAPADTINNTTVRVYWSSLDGTIAGERTGTDGLYSVRPTHTFLNDYQRTASVSFATPNATITKALEFTSESYTIDPNVAIGETVNFGLVVTMPEGTMTNLRITDTLPAGLEYLGYEVVTAAVNSHSRLTSNFNGIVQSDPALTVVGNVYTYTFTSDIVCNAEVGVNSNNAFMLRIIARVRNSPTNQRAQVLTNTAFMQYNDADGGTMRNPTGSGTVNSSVTIVEPEIAITKNRSLPAQVDAGGEVTFTVVLSHLGTSNEGAQDMYFADNLPAGLVNIHDVSFTPTGAGFTPPSSWEITGANLQNLRVPSTPDDSFDMPLGATLTITFKAYLDGTVQPSQIITNTGTAYWTSINGVPLAPAYERTGADGLQGGGSLNDYRINGTISLTADDGTFSKVLETTSSTLTSGSQVTIGEIITYGLVVTLPEGTTNNVVLTDTLQPGLIFVDATLETLAANSDGLLAGNFIGTASISSITPPVSNPPNEGGTATINLGTVSITGDNVTTNNALLVKVRARVLNTLANQANQSRTNSATMTYNNPAGGTITKSSGPVAATIIEPVLNLTKTVDTMPVPPDAGGVVRYQVIIRHDATTQMPASDLIFTDTLPAELGNIANVSITSTGAVPIPAPSYQISGKTLTIPAPVDGSFDLPLNAALTIAFDATVITAIPNQTITNMGDVIWSTLDGSDVGERTHGDGLMGVGGINDYELQSAAGFSTSGTSISKVRATTSTSHTLGSDLTIGETITYGLLVTLPEGNTIDQIVRDILPTGLQYQSYEIVTLRNNSLFDGSYLLDGDFNGTLPAETVTLPANPPNNGGTLQLDFNGTTSLPGDNIITNNTFLVLVTALTMDTPTNVGQSPQTNLVNIANMQAQNQSRVNSNTITATVVEPHLVITKSISPDQIGLNETATFTLTLYNDGNSNAYDVILHDPLPSSKYINVTEGTTPAGFSFTTFAGVDTLVIYASQPGVAIAPGDPPLTFTFTAQVVNIAQNEILTNTATVIQNTTLDGPIAGERDEPDVSASDGLTGFVIDLAISKDDSGFTAVPGHAVNGIIHYIVNYSNLGNQQATGVVITDVVPLYTTFNPAESTAGWNCLPDNSDGSTCTISIGAVNASSSGSVVFAVTVDNVLPVGVTEVENTASINDDGTHGLDIDLTNNSDDDQTPLDAAPDIAITKTDHITQTAAGATLTYELVISNLGNQDASGVFMLDTLPPEVINPLVTSITTTGGIPVPSSEILGGGAQVRVPSTADGGFNLPVGATVTVNIRVNVTDPVLGGATELVNTAHTEDDRENGPDRNPGNNDASDTDQIREVDKVIVANSQPVLSPLPETFIGETLTYETSIVVAPGELADLHLIDILDRGLVYVSCEGIIVTAGTLQSDPAYPFNGANSVCSDAAVSIEPVGSTNPADAGRKVEFTFGTVRNTGATDETLTVRYRVVVLDNVENVRFVLLRNMAAWTWTGGVISHTSDQVRIVEPTLNITKTVDQILVERDNIVTFTLVISHDGLSDSDAFDVTWRDPIPAGLIYVPGSLSFIGQVPDSFDDTTPPLLTATWANFSRTGGNVTITFQARVDLPEDSTASNSATLSWSSMPGPYELPQSIFNPLSTERFYDPLSSVNTYGRSASASVFTPQLPETGFAPGLITSLPLQKPEQSYDSMGNLWLEIPSLNIELPIVGIPLSGTSWDLTWLGNQAGYLEGTAFPTWTGNTGITAHVYDANGNPGPFVNLYKLKWGDTVQVHAFGKIYTYTVQKSYRTFANDRTVLRHENNPWLTLITCQGYNSKTKGYDWRVVVKASLTRVDNEPQADLP
jgi:LPXTG-site transpeptidase (sortase) family protein